MKFLMFLSTIGVFTFSYFLDFSATGSLEKHVDFNVIKITQNFTNIYVVQSGNTYLMIDSGNPNKGSTIESKLIDSGIDPKKIKYLILTHAHPDHAGNARFFQEKYGIKVLVGAGEEEIIEGKGKDNHICPRGPLGRLIKQTHAKRTYKDFEADIFIKGHFDLSTLGIKGSVHPIPGHTAGSVYIEVGDALFVGDLIRGKVLNSKKPAYHLFICDLQDNLQDIEELSQKSHINWWYPGHGGPIATNDIKAFIYKEQ
nr:MBL fold metallo-hydrolase [uncultured Allomuricauda sp.]